MIKLRHILFSILSLGCLFLVGCNAEVLNPMGPIAAAEKHLLIVAVLLMLIIVVPVIIAIFLIAYRFRESNTKAKYRPDWSHSVLLEIIWWTVPIIIISILATITWVTSHTLDPYRPIQSNTKPVTIQVISLEWRWLFIYPDQGIATMNFVEFPANTPINFLITSDAPMNSFQIQQLAGQIYAMAGMQTKLHLEANQVGDYNGRSVSFSGAGFTNMAFTARATTPQGFNQWVQSVKRQNNPLTTQAYNLLVPASTDTSVIYFSSVEKGLFGNVMMKYMMPMPSTSMAVPPQKSVENTNYNSDRNYRNHKDLISPITNTFIKG